MHCHGADLFRTVVRWRRGRFPRVPSKHCKQPRACARCHVPYSLLKARGAHTNAARRDWMSASRAHCACLGHRFKLDFVGQQAPGAAASRAPGARHSTTRGALGSHAPAAALDSRRAYVAACKTAQESKCNSCAANDLAIICRLLGCASKPTSASAAPVAHCSAVLRSIRCSKSKRLYWETPIKFKSSDQLPRSAILHSTPICQIYTIFKYILSTAVSSGTPRTARDTYISYAQLLLTATPIKIHKTYNHTTHSAYRSRGANTTGSVQLASPGAESGAGARAAQSSL
eukprot:IDg15741t1